MIRGEARPRRATLTTDVHNFYNASKTGGDLAGVSCIREHINHARASSTPEDPIETPGPFAVLTLVAPALALAVSWSVQRWRRALIARSEALAQRAAELEHRLRDAYGELGHWERRASLAASALTDVSAALPWDIATAERRIARLADDLREALADNASRQLRVIPATRSAVAPRSTWRAAEMPHERSA